MSSSTAPVRQLGKDGPLVSAIGFGLMDMSFQGYGTPVSKEGIFELLDRAVEIGATFWDTADLYGASEEIIGEWFKKTGKRDQVFIATKFGHLKNATNYHDCSTSAEYTKEACEASLKAFGIDCIDLFYVHRLNPETPIEETMRALKELQEAGKIKHIGLCGLSANTLRRAAKIAPVAAVQTEYDILTRGIENASGPNLLAACREVGAALVVMTPFNRGLLTDAFALSDSGSAEAAVGRRDESDIRALMFPRLSTENRPHNVQVVKGLKEKFANPKGCSVSQLALAWVMKQGDDIIPIPGTRKTKYLEANWAALDVKLSDEEDRAIKSYIEANPVKGGTVPAEYAYMMFLDTAEEKGA